MSKVEGSSGPSLEVVGSPSPSPSFKNTIPPSERDSMESSTSSESPSRLERIASVFKFILDCLCALFCCGKNDDSEDQGTRASQPFVSSLPLQGTPPPFPPPMPPVSQNKDLFVHSANSSDSFDLGFLDDLDPSKLDLSKKDSPPSRPATPLKAEPTPDASKRKRSSQELGSPADRSVKGGSSFPIESYSDLTNMLDELDQAVEASKKKGPTPAPQRKHRQEAAKTPIGSVREEGMEDDYLTCIKRELCAQVARLTSDVEKRNDIFGYLNMLIETAKLGENELKVNIWDIFDYLAGLEKKFKRFKAAEELKDLEKLLETGASSDLPGEEADREEAFGMIRETLMGFASHYLQTEAAYLIFCRQFELDQELEKILFTLEIGERRSIWCFILRVTNQSSFQQFYDILKGVLQRACKLEDSIDFVGPLSAGISANIERHLGAWAADLKVAMPLKHWMLGKEDKEIRRHYTDRITTDIRDLWGALLETDDEEVLATKLSEITESMTRATDVKSISDATIVISQFMLVEISGRVCSKKGELSSDCFAACADQYQAVLSSLTEWIFYSLPIEPAIEALRIVEESAKRHHTR